ncbi:MAG: hypothetical protein LUG16_05010 [Candidatus Gastranaerophilales bacterium]|nr:hypothetical protein [Candidatus Gastranaerophilales bacterium]
MDCSINKLGEFATNQEQNVAQQTTKKQKLKICVQNNNTSFISQNCAANYAKANINFKGQYDVANKEKTERNLAGLEKKLIEANTEDDDWYISKIINRIKTNDTETQQLLIDFINKLVEVSDISFSDNAIISDFISTINRTNLKSQQQIIDFAIELVESEDIKKDEIRLLPYVLMNINSDNPKDQQQLIDFARELIKSNDIQKDKYRLIQCILSDVKPDNTNAQRQLFDFGKKLIKSDKFDIQDIEQILSCLELGHCEPDILKSLMKLTNGLIDSGNTDIKCICNIINFYKSEDIRLDDASISDIITNANKIYANIIVKQILRNAKKGLDNIYPKDADLYYEKINEFYHGTSLDPAFADKKININGNEIALFFDNNIVAKSYIENMHMQGKQIPDNIQIVADSTLDTIQAALEQIAATGQLLPEKVYITDLMSKDIGGFSALNSIYVQSEYFERGCQDRAKDIIYHEAAHVADANLAKHLRYHSEEKAVKISKELEEVKFNDVVISKSKIQKLISNYAMTNPQELVAETSMLITRGTIKQKADGNYTIITEPDGFYHNAQSDVRFYESDIKDLNKIMKLYMYLTEGKISKPQHTT